MSAAWAYQIVEGEREEFAERKFERRIGTYEKTCRLVLKAIEIGFLSRDVPEFANRIQAADDAFSSNPTSDELTVSGTLGKEEILRRMSLETKDSRRLHVVPRYGDAVQTASLEVHLPPSDPRLQ
jgi:hypothetical protein